MRYTQARNYTPGRLRAPRLVVVHTVEGPEKPGTAWAVATWFAGQSAPQASAHFVVDAAEVVGCVRVEDTAWAAPGANADGIQLEHCGYAGQGAAGWADTTSQAILRRSASLARSLADRYQIPARHLTNAELAAGAAGFVGHNQVSQVYRRSDHTDPGPTFPWGQYLALVAASGGTSQPQPEDDMPLTGDDLATIWGGKATYPVRTNDRPERSLPDGSGAIAPISALSRTLYGVEEILTLVRSQQAVDVDKLAAAIVAKLPAGVVVDVQAVADAVVNELSARLVS